MKRGVMRSQKRGVGLMTRRKGQPDTKRRLKTSVAEYTVSKAPDDDGTYRLNSSHEDQGHLGMWRENYLLCLERSSWRQQS